MNCYFTCQKLSKFSKACFTMTKETALAPFNLAHPVGERTYVPYVGRLGVMRRRIGSGVRVSFQMMPAEFVSYGRILSGGDLLPTGAILVDGILTKQIQYFASMGCVLTHWRYRNILNKNSITYQSSVRPLFCLNSSKTYQLRYRPPIPEVRHSGQWGEKKFI